MARERDVRAARPDDGCDDPAEPRRRMAGLRPENAVTRETIGIPKAGDPRPVPEGPANREKTRVVERVRGGSGLAAAPGAAGPGRGAYHCQRAAMEAGDRHAVPRG
ncbi:hypothetical protein H7U32_07315, partial [Bifidobacterium pullorum subsp. saeculare]|nr:hypothetical protein [Bifidobacterium pullorum subsp. saeculare]